MPNFSGLQFLLNPHRPTKKQTPRKTFACIIFCRIAFCFCLILLFLHFAQLLNLTLITGASSQPVLTLLRKAAFPFLVALPLRCCNKRGCLKYPCQEAAKGKLFVVITLDLSKGSHLPTARLKTQESPE